MTWSHPAERRQRPVLHIGCLFRSRTAMNLPSGIVTFLFTDIEASTKILERNPEAMRIALSRHDTLASATITRHAGVLVRSRGEGDSLFAVFSRASDAVSAACALQQAFTSEAWPDAIPL